MRDGRDTQFRMPREPYSIHTQASHKPGFTADVSWLCISYGPGICPEHRLLCPVSLVRMIVCQYSDRAPAQRTENAALQLGGLPHLRVREARKRTGKGYEAESQCMPLATRVQIRASVWHLWGSQIPCEVVFSVRQPGDSRGEGHPMTGGNSSMSSHATSFGESVCADR